MSSPSWQFCLVRLPSNFKMGKAMDCQWTRGRLTGCSQLYVIVSLLTDHEPEHGPVLKEFIKWCKSAFPPSSINVSKTKEMQFDFRENPSDTVNYA